MMENNFKIYFSFYEGNKKFEFNFHMDPSLTMFFFSDLKKNSKILLLRFSYSASQKYF
jgi:hypothetical protein